MTEYKFHDYIKLRTIANSYKPENLHLDIDTSEGKFFVRADDNTKLEFTDDKGATTSTIETRSKKIARCFHDRVNSLIYFIDSEYDRGISYIWSLNYSDSNNISELGTISADIFDILKIEDEMYIMYFNAGVYDLEEIWIDPNSDVTTDWSFPAAGTHYTEIIYDSYPDYIWSAGGNEEDEFGFENVDLSSYDAYGPGQVYEIFMILEGLRAGDQPYIEGNLTGLDSREIIFGTSFGPGNFAWSNLDLAEADINNLQIKLTAKSNTDVRYMQARIRFYGDVSTSNIVFRKLSDSSEVVNDMGSLVDRSYNVSQVIVDGTDVYFLFKWSNEDVELWLYDQDGASIDQLLSGQTDYGTDSNLAPIHQRALTHDEGDIISHVIGEGKEETGTVICVYATVADNEYFDVYAPDEKGNEYGYRVWFDKSGGGSAPAIGDLDELVEVTIAVGTDQGTSDALQAGINNLRYLTASNNNGASPTVTIQSIYNGSVTDIVDGDTGLTIANTVQGTNNTYYYYTYSIADDEFIKGSEYNIALMLNRNTDINLDPPFNLEKGYDIELDKIHQISIDRGLLYLISTFDFIDTIISLTDTYVIDNSANIYELQDLINYVIKCNIEYDKEDYSLAKMEYLPQYISIEEDQFIQIIGYYTSFESFKLWTATENFETESIGTTGTEIDFVDDVDGNVKIIRGITSVNSGHGYIIEIDDDDGTVHGFQHDLDSNQTFGSIEFKILVDDATKEANIGFYDSSDDLIAGIRIDADNWYTYSGSSWTDQTELGTPIDNTWYIIRIDWETTAGAYLGLTENFYQVYINGTPTDAEIALETNDTNLSYFVVGSQATDQDYKIYFDAYGCPQEDADYTLGDNDIVKKGQPNSVIFEGIAKIPSKGDYKSYVLIVNQGEEMDQVEPRGEKAGTTDAIITDINNDTSNNPEYIRDGILETGVTISPDPIYSGAKKLRRIYNNLKDIDLFTWYLKPQGPLNYNDGSLETGAKIRFDGSTYLDVILNVKAFGIESINKVIVHGAFNLATAKPFTGTWNDIEEQQQKNIHLIVVNDASLKSNTLCETKADKIGEREVATRSRIQYQFRKPNYGVMQVGETFLTKYTSTHLSIAQGDHVLNHFSVDIKSEMSYIDASTGLVFNYGKIYDELPEENNQLIMEVGGDLNNIVTDTKEPTGFVDAENEVTLSWDNGNLRLTLTPQSTEYSYYIKGIKFTKTSAETIDITDTEGLWYLYYDGETLSKTQTWNSNLVTDYAIVSIVYWDATNNIQIFFADEMHGCSMSGATHKMIHDIFGATLEFGGALTSILADNNGADNEDCEFGVEATEMHDEDIEFEYSARGSTDNIPLYYMTGADASDIWRVDESDSLAAILSGVGGEDRASYNELNGGTWSLTEVANTKFLLSHVFITNDPNRPYGVIVGQNQYNTKSLAQDGALTEINSLVLHGLPTPEFVFIATLIIQTADSYGNDVQSRIVSTADGGDYVDLRDAIIGRGTTAGGLNNVVDDTTPQLGGMLDLNSNAITIELIAGATLAVGDLCYLKLADQEMYKAKADDDATCNTLLAISLDTPDDGEVGTFLLFGNYTHDSAIFSAGEIHYVSDTAAGEIVDEDLIPDTTGDIVRIVGYGISTTILFFNPDKTYLELS